MQASRQALPALWHPCLKTRPEFYSAATALTNSAATSRALTSVCVIGKRKSTIGQGLGKTSFSRVVRSSSQTCKRVMSSRPGMHRISCFLARWAEVSPQSSRLWKEYPHYYPINFPRYGDSSRKDSLKAFSRFGNWDICNTNSKEQSPKYWGHLETNQPLSDAKRIFWRMYVLVDPLAKTPFARLHNTNDHVCATPTTSFR